jgi:phosphoserine phosphatase RsbU/P
MNSVEGPYARRDPAGEVAVPGAARGASLTAGFKYRLLLEIFRGAQDTLDLAETLNRLLDSLASVLTYDAAGIFVLEREPLPYALEQPRLRRPQQLIAAVALRGFDERPAEDDLMLTQGKGIIGHVILSGQCVVAPDVRLDPRYFIGRASTRSEIAVPIAVGQRIIGALNLESDALGAYADEDVEGLLFFAEAAAISIEKAMLHQRIVEKEQLEKQLLLAQAVQQRLLPAQAPELAGYDLAGLCIPSHEVGGDYYDYIPVAGGRIGVTVADVSGKGVAAALIMAAFRALLRAQVSRGTDPSRTVVAVNERLLDSTAQYDFVTCIYGVLELETGRFVYVNCGHSRPLVARCDGRVEFLPGGNLVLGIFAEARFDAHQVILEPGDLLVLYTDGVVETEDPEGRQFGQEGLARVMGRRKGWSAAETMQALREAVLEHAGSSHYDDDFTLVVIGRR